MIQAIIVDDEPNNIDALKLQIKRLTPLFKEEIQIIGIANSYDEVLELLKLNPELIFLDNDLGTLGKDGFTFFKDHILSTTIEVIFITAEFKDLTHFFANSLKDLGINVLHRPVSDNRLTESINKFLNSRSGKEHLQEIKNIYSIIRSASVNPFAKRSIRINNHQILYDEIVYIIGDGSSSTFFLSDQKSIPTGYTLSHWVKRLSDDGIFKRISKDTILNFKYFYKVKSPNLVLLKSSLLKQIAKNPEEEKYLPSSQIEISKDAFDILKWQVVGK